MVAFALHMHMRGMTGKSQGCFPACCTKLHVGYHTAPYLLLDLLQRCWQAQVAWRALLWHLCKRLAHSSAAVGSGAAAGLARRRPVLVTFLAFRPPPLQLSHPCLKVLHLHVCQVRCI